MKFLSNKVKILGVFDPWKDSQPTNLEWKLWMMVKLNFIELRDSNLSGLLTFDKGTISLGYWIVKMWSNQKGSLWVHRMLTLGVIFCEPCWKFICFNKERQGTQRPSKISKPTAMALGTNFLSPIVLPTDAKVSWPLLLSSILRTVRGVFQSENTIYLSRRWQIRSKNAKNRQELISFTTMIKIRLPKLILACLIVQFQV